MVVPAVNDEINPIVMAAAQVAGVDRVFSIGGAQAIAALAYGAGPVPAVDKIVGPGNRYVAAAKRLVFGVVGIDMIAGPSEVVIVADESADPDWITMDMFAQAEHDEDARAILVTTDASLPEKVENSINRQIGQMERAAIIRASLENNGALIRAGSIEQACDIVNRLAPEHLELARTGTGQLPGRHQARRCDLPWAFCPGGNRRLLRRSEPRAAHRQNRKILFPTEVFMISRSAHRSSIATPRLPQALPAPQPYWPAQKGCRPMHAPPNCA